jgi:hypothetical protein
MSSLLCKFWAWLIALLCFLPLGCAAEYRDLLAKGGRNKEEKKHQVIHNADGSTTVTDLVSVDVSTPAKVSSSLWMWGWCCL